MTEKHITEQRKRHPHAVCEMIKQAKIGWKPLGVGLSKQKSTKYENGYRTCTKCDYTIKTKLVFCPCCGNRFRIKRRMKNHNYYPTIKERAY